MPNKLPHPPQLPDLIRTPVKRLADTWRSGQPGAMPQQLANDSTHAATSVKA